MAAAARKTATMLVTVDPSGKAVACWGKSVMVSVWKRRLMACFFERPKASMRLRRAGVKRVSSGTEKHAGIVEKTR